MGVQISVLPVLIGVHVEAEGSGIGVHGPVGTGTIVLHTVTFPTDPVAETPVTGTRALITIFTSPRDPVADTPAGLAIISIATLIVPSWAVPWTPVTGTLDIPAALTVPI
jgi:hypothetical protein